MVIKKEDYVSVADGFLFGLGLGMSFVLPESFRSKAPAFRHGFLLTSPT